MLLVSMLLVVCSLFGTFVLASLKGISNIFAKGEVLLLFSVVSKTFTFSMPLGSVKFE